MWDKIKLFFVTAVKPIDNFLTAHPKFKNILSSLEKVVITSVLGYFATVLKSIVDSITAGAPMPHDFHLLLVGFGGGLYIAVSGAIRAWAQENHDKILAVVQDNVMALPQEVPIPTNSVLTPLPAPPKTTP
jgi:hypothetical protein